MRKVWVILAALVCSVNVVPASPVTINISGTVTKTGGTAVEGATITLIKIKGISATTDAQGNFIMSGTVKALQLNSPKAAPIDLMIRGNAMVFSAAAGKITGSVDVFTGNGRIISSNKFSNLKTGNNVTLPEFCSGLNIIRVTMGSEIYTCPIIRLGNETYFKNDFSNSSVNGNFKLTKQTEAAVSDTLITKKTGLQDKKTPIASYSVPSVAIVMDTGTSLPPGAKEVSCTVPLPTTTFTKTNAKFPDLFLMSDGKRMTKKSEWCQQRAYLSSLLQVTSLGEKPPKPDEVIGSYSSGTLTITCKVGSKSKSFTVKITGNSGTKPVPAIICHNGSSVIPIPAGIAQISFTNGTIAEQASKTSRGKGLFYDLYGNSHSAGAMMAWAWGVSRVLDALESTPAANIDPTRCGVTGCSRDGKGAMVCGAFDERIALTLAMEGGSGGISSWRIAQVENSNKTAHPDGCQTASEIITENAWMSSNFDKFATDITKLPTDAHTLAAMCAPRPLFMIEGSQNSWNCNVCCWTAASAAKMVYEVLGFKTNIGLVMNNHTHCDGPSSTIPRYGVGEKDSWNAFCKRFLLGDETVSTDLFKNDGSFDKLIDFTKWIDWTTPTLE